MKVEILVICKEPSKYPDAAALGGTCGASFRANSWVLLQRLLDEHENECHYDKEGKTE